MITDITALGRKLSDTTIQMHEAIAAAAGLSGTDHKYLYLIIDYGPITAGQLAQRARLTTGAITGIIDRLEKRKLVKRVYDKTDRRKVRIVANKTTVDEILTPLSAQLKERITHLIDTYSPEEQALIKRYLNDSITVMHKFIEDLRNHPQHD